MTIESPKKTSRVVPANSAAYMRGCNLSNGCGIPRSGWSILTLAPLLFSSSLSTLPFTLCPHTATWLRVKTPSLRIARVEEPAFRATIFVAWSGRRSVYYTRIPNPATKEEYAHPENFGKDRCNQFADFECVY